MSSLLVSYAKQMEIKPISYNNQSKYEQIATEVEAFELLQLISLEMYQDLVDNPTTDANVSLLNGCSFENYNGNTVNHKGLRYVIAYLNYSKYVGESFVSDTYTGFVQQNRPEATFLSDGQIKRIQENARKIALTAWETVKEYLDKNYTLYPYWSYTEEKKIYTPKFGSVKKTKYLGDKKYTRCFTTGKRFEE